ncbi:MAG: hypothetical protein AB7S74_19075 [Hyphomicrobium sp.]
MTTGAQLTSTQKGKVTEQMVASTLLIASNGRLAPFVPLADDHGLDLIVLDKLTRRSISIQIKSAIANASRGTVQFDVRKQTYSKVAGEYLLMVVFEPARMALAASWLIPMSIVPDVATEQADKYALVPSLKATAKDRCRPYRHDDAHALVAAIQNELDGG